MIEVEYINGNLYASLKKVDTNGKVKSQINIDLKTLKSLKDCKWKFEWSNGTSKPILINRELIIIGKKRPLFKEPLEKDKNGNWITIREGSEYYIIEDTKNSRFKFIISNTTELELLKMKVQKLFNK